MSHTKPALETGDATELSTAQTFVVGAPGGESADVINVHTPSRTKRLMDSQRRLLLTNLLHSNSQATLETGDATELRSQSGLCRIEVQGRAPLHPHHTQQVMLQSSPLPTYEINLLQY